MNLFSKRCRRKTQRILKQRLQLQLRLLHRHARLQATVGPHRTPRVGLALCHFIERLRHQYINKLEPGHLEALWQNTNHTNGLSVDVYKPLQNAAIASEAALPHLIRDQSDPRCMRTILLDGEVTTNHRDDTERRKKASLHAR